MKDTQCFCTRILLIMATLRFLSASEDLNDIKKVAEKQSRGLKLENIVAMWNKSLDNSHESIFQRNNLNFAAEISKCIEERQYQITENISQGKALILNCFKTTLMLNILKYMAESTKSSIKLFNGVLELEKISEDCEEASENLEETSNCVNKYSRHFKADKKAEYLRMYEKAMLKLMSERNRLNAYRNQTEKEKEKLLNRINENSQAFLSEVIRSIGDEKAEKMEEEKIKKEMTDPKLLAVLDEASKNFMLKLRFYPGMAARMKRSHNGGFTFDLLIEEPSEESDDEEEKQVFSDEESTREIKDGPQSKDYDDEDDDSNKRKKAKKDKKKKKEKKKKAKKLKKIVPYLLIPMLIQMTLLPFVFKKLFFLAMKALFAGKVALILVGFNLLRNTCIKDDDDFQKIRVEHYGYRRGEEYGAWVNGRSFQEFLIMSALKDRFFEWQNNVTS